MMLELVFSLQTYKKILQVFTLFCEIGVQACEIRLCFCEYPCFSCKHYGKNGENSPKKLFFNTMIVLLIRFVIKLKSIFLICMD